MASNTTASTSSGVPANKLCGNVDWYKGYTKRSMCQIGWLLPPVWPATNLKVDNIAYRGYTYTGSSRCASERKDTAHIPRLESFKIEVSANKLWVKLPLTGAPVDGANTDPSLH